MKSLALSLIAALGLSAGAQAATFEGVVAGTATHTEYSEPGLISFDLDFASLGTTTLRYVVEAADLGSLSFNALLINRIGLGGVGVTGYRVDIGAGLFASVGTAYREFSESYARVDFNGSSAVVDFGTPEFYDVRLGDPKGYAGNVNWSITGLNAGDVLNISVTAVPEPEGLAMLLAGLGAVAAFARRRRSAA